jgi:hypothetical protein
VDSLDLSIVVASVLTPFFYWGFLTTESRRRRFEDTPTSKAVGVFIGEVELEGTAEASVPLGAPLSGQDSVWYRWEVAEEWRRIEKVKLSPSRAKALNKEYEEREIKGWKVVDGGTAAPPFYLKDDTGCVRINPEKADIQPVLSYSETFSRSASLYHKAGPQTPIPDSTGRRRFTEYTIPLHHPIFVSGHSRVRDDAVAAELAWDKDSRFFLISTKTEKKQIYGQRGKSFGCQICFVGLSAFILGGLFRDWNQAILGGVLGFVAVLFGWAWIVHQSMIKLKNRSNQAKSNMDVELKRRHSLIPLLIETVKGFRDHERGTLSSLTTLRSQLAVDSVDAAGTEGTFIPMAKDLMAVSEKYPELKSSALFLNLQKNLAETEERIALARTYYNDTVQYVNTRREVFPEGLIARLSGVKKMDYFHAENFERHPVTIET